MGRAMNDAAKWWYYVRQNGASYYPQTVANLGYDVWDWDASKLATLYQDSAKTTPVASNSDPVGAWVDGVQGVDAIQATTANKPTYTTASLGTLPTLGFDGGDLLVTGNISISTFAVWVVFACVGGSRIIYEQSVNSSANDGMRLDALSTTAILVRRSSTSVSKQGVTLSDNIYRSVRVEHNGTFASLKYFANNSELTTTGTGSDIGTGTATAPLFIGARSGVLFTITGNIAHLCIVSPYPTAEIIANMESYINGIWSVY